MQRKRPRASIDDATHAKNLKLLQITSVFNFLRRESSSINQQNFFVNPSVLKCKALLYWTKQKSHTFPRKTLFLKIIKLSWRNCGGFLSKVVNHVNVKNDTQYETGKVA